MREEGRDVRIRDLLSKNPKQKLELKDHPEGGVFVKDLTNMIVKGAPDLQQVMEVPERHLGAFFPIFSLSAV